jgi:hypothetical protein
MDLRRVNGGKEGTFTGLPIQPHWTRIPSRTPAPSPSEVRTGKAGFLLGAAHACVEWHRNAESRERASDLCFLARERKPERRTQHTHAHMKREGGRESKEEAKGKGEGGEEEVAVFGVKGEVG